MSLKLASSDVRTLAAYFSSCLSFHCLIGVGDTWGELIGQFWAHCHRLLSQSVTATANLFANYACALFISIGFTKQLSFIKVRKAVQLSVNDWKIEI